MTSARELLPDFLVIGAMKAGTTSLFNYLGAHPDIFLPRTKELDFFVDGPRGAWHLGVDWYRQQFEGGGSAAARGEASPNYTKFPTFPDVPKRIRSVLGADVRLIYLLRDPVDRLKSHWAHNRSVYGTGPSLAEAAAEGHMRACSNYALQVEQYLDCFDASQLLVVTTEALEAEPRSTMERIVRFLGVCPGPADWDLSGRYHRSGQKPFPRFGHRVAPAYRWSRAGGGAHRAAIRRLLARRLRTEDLELPEDEVALRAAVGDEIRRLQALVDADVTRWGPEQGRA